MATKDIIFLYDDSLSALKEQSLSASESGYYVLSNPSPANPVNEWILTMGKGILDYNVLINKPTLENVTISGDKMASDFGLVTEQVLLSSLSSITINIDGLSSDILTLSSDLDTAESNILTLSSGLSSVENEITILSGNIYDIEQDIFIISNEIININQDLSSLSSEIDSKVDIINGFSVNQDLSSALITDKLSFTPITGINSITTGDLVYNADEHCLSFGVEDGSLELGKEVVDVYTNLAGVTLNDGDIVSVCGVAGNREAVCLTDIRNPILAKACIGMVTRGNTVNQLVRVTKIGKVHGLNTNDYTEGTELYVSTNNPGKWSTTPPSAPYTWISIGLVEVKNQNNGVVSLNIRISPRLQDLSDINGTPLTTSGQLITWHPELSAFDFDKNINSYALSSTVNNLSNSLSSYVPYIGATNNLNLGNNQLSSKYIITDGIKSVPVYDPEQGIGYLNGGIGIGKNLDYYIVEDSDENGNGITINHSGLTLLVVTSGGSLLVGPTDETALPSLAVDGDIRQSSISSNGFVKYTNSDGTFGIDTNEYALDSTVTNLNNNLSAYATLSGSTFTGNIYASNLAGINTGDQDLSPYATNTILVSSISEHNESVTAHQDIRTLITNSTSGLSSYVPYNGATNNVNLGSYGLSGGTSFISASSVGSGNAPLVVKQLAPYASPYTQNILTCKNATDTVIFNVNTGGIVTSKYSYADSFASNTLGTAPLPVYGINSNNLGMYFPTVNSIGWSTSGINRMTLDNNGLSAITTFISASSVGVGNAPLVVQQLAPYASPFTQYIQYWKNSANQNIMSIRTDGRVDISQYVAAGFYYGGNGSASIPVFSLNTGGIGMYFPSTSAIRWSTASTDRLQLNAIQLSGNVEFVAPSAKFGSSTDYTQFEADGTMVCVGSATTFEDRVADITTVFSTGPGVSLNNTESTIDFINTSNLSDYIIANYQMSHKWKAGSNIYPHIHWNQTSNSVPNFLIRYRWQRNGQAKTTAWSDLICITNAFTYTAGTLNQISYSAAITPPANYSISDIIQFRIFRDTGNASTAFSGADTYSGTVAIMGVDVHFEQDTLGSRSEYSK